ncbi:MAG: hypothetical protein ACFFCS_07585 [Candidatus Hodarchaeota archaeon]
MRDASLHHGVPAFNHETYQIRMLHVRLKSCPSACSRFLPAHSSGHPCILDACLGLMLLAVVRA